MQKMFIEGKEAPPIAHNLPPIARLLGAGGCLSA